MTLADASVWIDLLRGRSTEPALRLAALFETGNLAVADLTIAEVLQGRGSERDFELTREGMLRLPVIGTGGAKLAVETARNYRRLRALGVTVRGTIDCIIATRCILGGHALLFSDRDFLPFVEHLGLHDAMSA